MDKDRIRQAALGRRSRAPGSGREKLRMLVYGAAAAAIAGYLSFGVDRREAPADALPVERHQAPREYQPLSQVDPARLAAVRDDTGVARAVLEPGPLQHLVGEASKLVYGDMQQLGVQAVPRDELLADSAAFRGRPLWVLGTLQWYAPDTFTVPHSFRGELHDEAGASWLFQVVDLPGEVDVGDVVRLNGFFLKHHDMLRPDRSFASGPLLVGDELLPSAFRIEPVTRLTPEMFWGVRDHDIEQASRPLDSLAYFRLLSYVQNVPADEIFGPVGSREPVYPSELIANQDDWRGEPVTIRGNLMHVQRTLLGPEGENPLGVTHAWELWLLNRRNPVRVVMLEEPVGLVGDRDMLVDVDGLFFRRQLYENKHNQAMLAAVVIGARAREFIIPEDALSTWVQRFVLTMGLALLAVIVLAQRREGRVMARARVRSVARKKKLLALPGTLQGLRASRVAAGRRGHPAPDEPAAGAGSVEASPRPGDAPAPT